MMIMMAGLLGTLMLGYFAFAGPSASKAQNRRLEVVRERHSKSNEVAAQAQLKRILQSRTETKMEGFAQRFIPNPALLRTRLNQTGRKWTLVQYTMVSVAIGCAEAASSAEPLAGSLPVPGRLITIWTSTRIHE